MTWWFCHNGVVMRVCLSLVPWTTLINKQFANKRIMGGRTTVGKRFINMHGSGSEDPSIHYVISLDRAKLCKLFRIYRLMNKRKNNLPHLLEYTVVGKRFIFIFYNISPVELSSTN